MSIVDKQITAALDRLHAQNGHGQKPCQWMYNSNFDYYQCLHTGYQGNIVIAQIKDKLTDE